MAKFAQRVMGLMNPGSTADAVVEKKEEKPAEPEETDEDNEEEEEKAVTPEIVE